MSVQIRDLKLDRVGEVVSFAKVNSGRYQQVGNSVTPPEYNRSQNTNSKEQHS